jgi:TMEM151 family
VSFSAVAYHYELRTRLVTYTDSSGNRRTRTETYRVKVITDRVTTPYQFQFWQDRSQTTLGNIHTKKITKIKMELCVLFGNADTARDFDERYAQFQRVNRHLDEFVDFSISRTVTGFEERLAAYVDVNAKSGWISLLWYWLSTLLCLGWIYRVIFNAVTEKTHFKVVKLIFVGHSHLENNEYNNGATTNYTSPCGTQIYGTPYDGVADVGEGLPHYGSLFLQTKRNIETILRSYETAAIDVDDTVPLLADDTEYMHIAIADQSQLRVAI